VTPGEPPRSAWTITLYGEGVIEGTAGPRGPSGGETAFWPVPARRWYAAEGGALIEGTVIADLEGLADACAARAGRTLYSAGWVITADRAQIRAIGATEGCAEGWPGLAAILPWLARHPGAEVACGVLRWLAEPGP
jgi:hypothetical protein